MKNINRIANFYKALGDPTRLKLIKLLASNSEKTFCVNDIAEHLGITQSAVSQHLRILRNIGLVNADREGCYVFYTIDANVLSEYKSESDQLYKLVFKKCNTNCHEC